MYLKSLTLKGFKSFADKTTLTFDPGLTVIVGPNGSGKSNVSDAILWVLGEQSPKALRGQAMEDVIFSGSSARKPVSMAEVTLVLDNSDHTLPIEYAEVAVTRRMYRSGESEYLVNGSQSRLMDIRDILHDSGLGKETHSIISQGHLDSVLSGRPEDRRELIEEAAGIAKHRRRKERSERRLKSMDENLTRAKDINREIHRQLRPLERQATKARRARELSAELRDLSLRLAVDDLRRLQGRHEELERQGREAEAAVELARVRLGERSRELERYQHTLEERGVYVGDLDAQRRRVAAQLAQMSSDLRLLEEKARGMDTRERDLAEAVEGSERERRQASEEAGRVEEELGRARAEWDELRRRVDELTPKAKEATRRRRELASRVSKLQGERQEAQRTADRETLAYAKLRDQVDNAQVEDQMFQGRLDQLSESLESCQGRLDERGRRRDELTAALAEAQGLADGAREEIGAGQDRVRSARKAEASARERLAQAKATLAALRSVDERAGEASPLAAALARRGDLSQEVEARLGDLLEAPAELEGLVERLLGEDLNALVLRDGSSVPQVAEEALGIPGTSGTVTLMSRDLARQAGAGEAGGSPATGAPSPGEPLLARLRVREGAEALVGSLLGDVRVVPGAGEAVRAHAARPSLTYVTPDGACVLPDGRTVIGAGPAPEQGALERKRQIRGLEGGMEALEAALGEAGAEASRADEALSAARERNAQAKGEVARLRGELSSVTSEVGRLEGERRRAEGERAQVERRRAEAAKRVEAARSEIGQHREASERASARAEELAGELERLTQERGEASHQESEADRRLSEARLRLATVTERKNHLITRSDELARRLSRLEESGGSASTELAALRVRRRRVEPLKARYDQLGEVARAWASRLADRASLAEADSDQLKQTIAAARREVGTATAELERARAATGDAKVERGKVEVQVEAAVSAIEAKGARLEEALTLPAPDDRAAAEARVEELAREIRSIGPVNEVAMEQYVRLKERADYIGEQVADLEAARKSLAKITSAIDRKMRRRFLVVFDQVDANFSEMFRLLFPGGEARIEMTDPDHPAETGIEIVAQPQGKRLQKMMLMSGGEKSLTALALLFAVYKTRTVPFYVFDEIEAALDDANLSRLLGAIDQLRGTTQLIAISHQRRTMEDADVLYGISMQADGVSHVVSQRLDHTGRKVDA